MSNVTNRTPKEPHVGLAALFAFVIPLYLTVIAFWVAWASIPSSINPTWIEDEVGRYHLWRVLGGCLAGNLICWGVSVRIGVRPPYIPRTGFLTTLGICAVAYVLVEQWRWVFGLD